MFGFGKPIFSGSVSDDNGNSADVELDGSGYYKENRKVWRYRLTGGSVETDSDLSMEMGNKTRSARINSDPDDSNYGYIELF
ncbi:MAG: hypothetical protein QNJ45_15545 [Ardenticatenaceae bacterium]|nr:hypothetical protein [Ardenticatenaceae bacterium]